MAGLIRRLVSQTARLTLAAFAVASVSNPHNAASAAVSTDTFVFRANGGTATTLQPSINPPHATRLDGDDGLDPLIHHHYP